MKRIIKLLFLPLLLDLSTINTRDDAPHSTPALCGDDDKTTGARYSNTCYWVSPLSQSGISG